MIWLFLACTKALPLGGSELSETYTQVSGVVFEFSTRERVPAASIVLHLRDRDPLELQSDESGNWSAAVPNGVPFTPELMIEGYLPAKHATFVMRDPQAPNLLERPGRLDLQAVPLATFQRMSAGLTGTRLSRDACLVVDTVTITQVYSMASFAEFIPLRPHGEPGVHMRLEPDPGVDPIYFDEGVLPDRSLQATSRDGGVVWLNVPPGVYTVTGEHPDPALEVVPRQVECRAGELVNLNPPMGAGVRVKR